MTRCTDTCCVPEREYVEYVQLSFRYIGAARKSHVDFRGHYIPAGRAYYREVERYDGTFYCRKWCAKCWEYDQFGETYELRDDERCADLACRAELVWSDAATGGTNCVKCGAHYR